MSAVIVLGTQWGDEGKGKATDQFDQNTDYVVKFNDGSNIGHTVVIDGEKYALHLLPAGILPEGVTPVISNGVVVDIEVMFQEINEMASHGVGCSHLKISSNARIIPSYSRLMDQTNERARGKNQIRTTGRGIGPTYADKMSRIGIHIRDLFDPEGLAEKIEAALAPKNEIFAAVGMEALNPEIMTEELLAYADRTRPMVCGVSLEVNEALDRGDTILFEGGQVTILDINHGTYPFVTSSNPTVGGALIGIGVGLTRTDRVIGIAEAYMTRVGEGPFPTELDDEVGGVLRIKGGKFNVTTGRAHRTGWFNAIIVRCTTRISGFTDVYLTKLGVLSGYPLISVCVAYEIDGVRAEEIPFDQAGFAEAIPVYEELPGQDEDISGRRTFKELPTNAQAYTARLEELSKCQIQSIGVDPGREATIVRYPLIRDRAAVATALLADPGYSLSGDPW